MTLLSIVLPCFDRHDLVTACIGSMVALERNLIEVVLVDDGSEPPLESIARGVLRDHDQVLRQANRGRSAALRNGIVAASGEFVLIMDSDDEFIHGAIDRILADIANLPTSLVGIAYECVDFNSGEVIAALPDGVTATLLSLRADHLVKGDLKEVIRTSLVKAALYPDPGQERRVPTSYIWAGVSALGPVVTCSAPVVRHRYLEGGMTRSIATLKKQNPFWLARTYLRIATAPPNAYHSRRFRLTNAIKARSIRGARLKKEDLLGLRRSLGLLDYCAAKVGGMLLMIGGLR